MKTIIKFFLVFLLLNSGVCVEQKQVIKIGVIGPFSGDMAFIGEGVRNSATLALENLGQTKYRYELVFEDYQLDAKKVPVIFHKLTSVDRVDAVFSVWSLAGFVVSPMAERARVLHVSNSWESKVTAGKYNFNVCDPPAEQTRVMTAALKKRGIQKVALFYVKSSGTMDQVNAMKAQLPAAGIEIVGEESCDFPQRDFRTQLAKLREKKPQIYWFSLWSPQIELATKQMREIDPQAAITTNEAFDETQEPQLFNGCWYASAAMPSAAFAERYRKRFGAEITNSTTHYSYDIVQLIVKAFEGCPGAQKPTSTQAMEVLAGMPSFPGVNGTLEQDKDGYFRGQATIKEIRDGKRLPLGE